MLAREVKAELGPQQAARPVVRDNKVWQFSVVEQLGKACSMLQHGNIKTESSPLQTCPASGLLALLKQTSAVGPENHLLELSMQASTTRIFEPQSSPVCNDQQNPSICH